MLNCNCHLKPVLQHINLKSLEGETNIDLTAFSSLLTEESIAKINTCLPHHGFNGYVASEDFHNTGHLEYTYWSN